MQQMSIGSMIERSSEESGCERLEEVALLLLKAIGQALIGYFPQSRLDSTSYRTVQSVILFQWIFNIRFASIFGV